MQTNESRPVGRMLFAAALFGAAWSAQNGDFVAVLWPGGVAAVVLAWLDVRQNAPWHRSLRAGWRVLRWLVWPVMLLHVMLAGGARIWPEWGWSPTWEGVRDGGWLALRLMALYGTAMLLARLPGADFWQGAWLRRRWPVVWRALRLLDGLRRGLTADARAVGRRFRLLGGWRQCWRDGGRLLAAVIRRGWRDAARAADAMWLRWPSDAPSGAGTRMRKAEAIWLAAAVAVIGLAAMQGGA